jgi:hypothetical protein
MNRTNSHSTSAVIPEIVQSDNGGEFLGDCIQKIRKCFGTIRIAKGKPRIHLLREV